jgi:signal transduction histidine kinase
MQEDRLLRAVIVTQVEGAIGRQMDVAEAAALHATVDVMLQQSVIALVEEQKTELRQSSERELKYLSFLSHDLNNHLSGVSLMLKLLRPEVEGMGGSSGAVTLIDNADQGIRDTVQGMRRLLEHERLRKGGADTDTQPMRLRGFLSSLAEQFAAEAKTKSLRLVIEADEGAVVNTDPELVSLVMRNLIGNAIKYTNGRTVRIGGEQRPFETRQQWVLWVADDGPGIAPEHLTRIFEAFQRGKVFGQEGVGLGLAIASQAARLLNAALRVESKVGEGSKFYLELRGRS